MPSFNVRFVYFIDDKWYLNDGPGKTELVGHTLEEAKTPKYDVYSGVYELYVPRIGDKLYFNPDEYFYVPPFSEVTSDLNHSFLADWREYAGFVRTNGCDNIHGIIERKKVPKKYLKIFQLIHDLFITKFDYANQCGCYYSTHVEREYGLWLALQLVRL